MNNYTKLKNEQAIAESRDVLRAMVFSPSVATVFAWLNAPASPVMMFTLYISLACLAGLAATL